MTTFPTFAYKRPQLKSFSKRFQILLDAFKAAPTTAARVTAIKRLNRMRKTLSTMYNLAMVRHTLDTRDKQYESENDWFDANVPQFEELVVQYYRALLAAPDRDGLVKKFGAYLFTQAELALKTMTPEVMDDLVLENSLSSEYTRIKAQAVIHFEGKQYNLSSIIPLEQSADRHVRKQASAAKWAFFAEREAEFDRIFDEMVAVRTRIARKLGYANFIELGYARMKRSDYTPEMVAVFRQQVQDVIVPIATSLYKRQQKRLGLKKLYNYDEDCKFPNGNATPQGTPEQIVAHASRMYSELSPETDQLFTMMQQTGLMDLVNRDGKATGGYCTYMEDYKAPFIFSNFNGTSGDIDVLTHEAGHAFQVWLSGRFELPEYLWPTSDAAEIHSMSMEFLTWPWMEGFFGEQTAKYHFSHMANSIQFIPYGVAVDEFQHVVYANPDLTPAERRAEWSKIEAKYLPQRNYDRSSYLSAGGFWQKQSHIFNSPFYYIDYTLAQFCAFQFWQKDRKNHATAWRDYLKLCKAGGSASFLDLVKLARLKSPFDAGTVASVAGSIKKWLKSVDDSGF